MSFQKNHVILVNEQDEWLGTIEKLEAHERGLLHRAFSIFVLNEQGEMLLQRRAMGKYHSEGLWSNTCCSHPLPGESTLAGAHRRLMEEMGFDCALQAMFHLRYKAEVSNNLVENEYDHVYLGYYNGAVHPAPEEVMDYRFINIEHLQEEIGLHPEQFTPWLALALPQFLKSLRAAAA